MNAKNANVPSSLICAGATHISPRHHHHHHHHFAYIEIPLVLVKFFGYCNLSILFWLCAICAFFLHFVYLFLMYYLQLQKWSESEQRARERGGGREIGIKRQYEHNQIEKHHVPDNIFCLSSRLFFFLELLVLLVRCLFSHCLRVRSEFFSPYMHLLFLLWLQLEEERREPDLLNGKIPL